IPAPTPTSGGDTSEPAPVVAPTPPPIAPSPESTAAVATEAPPGTIRFPRHGRLEYAVTIGEPPTPIGRAVYAWEASESAYWLTLSAQTTGLVGLLRRVRVTQLSQGRITPDGLRPDAFQMDRGANARNEFARFDWAAKQLTFGYPDATQTATLVNGAQDTLSLILQFAFVPIAEGRRELQLTTGRRLSLQSYERVTDDLIDTPGGAWRAWHLRRVRTQPDDEGYDIWLAVDRPFLPVRIRWTDRNGRVTSANVDTVHVAND
ncbi:MAG: DUF3108 domain-containing protein, partial [Proteobacteria bacterium]|nr:DUF3108 domain-containing protein [Burkholderiales bacterium]